MEELLKLKMIAKKMMESIVDEMEDALTYDEDTLIYAKSDEIIYKENE